MLQHLFVSLNALMVVFNMHSEMVMKKVSLSTEQTRECMKLSMGTIKNKMLPLPDGTEVVLQKSAIRS